MARLIWVAKLALGLALALAAVDLWASAWRGEPANQPERTPHRGSGKKLALGKDCGCHVD